MLFNSLNEQPKVSSMGFTTQYYMLCQCLFIGKTSVFSSGHTKSSFDQTFVFNQFSLECLKRSTNWAHCHLQLTISAFKIINKIKVWFCVNIQLLVYEERAKWCTKRKPSQCRVENQQKFNPHMTWVCWLNQGYIDGRQVPWSLCHACTPKKDYGIQGCQKYWEQQERW